MKGIKEGRPDCGEISKLSYSEFSSEIYTGIFLKPKKLRNGYFLRKGES